MTGRLRQATPLIGLLLCGALAGCGNDTTGPAPLDPAVLPWQLVLNVDAVTLSTAPGYNTLQLVPVLQTVSGAPVPGAVTFAYTSPDPTSVLVDSTGRLTAVGQTAVTPVTVQATSGPVSLTATILVRVTAEQAPPVLDHLVLNGTQIASPAVPTPPGIEGLVVDCGSNGQNAGVMRAVQLQLRVLTATEEIASDAVLVSYRSSEPRMLGVSADGTLSANCYDGRTGPVTITASVSAYGVTKRASVPITVIPKLAGMAYIMTRQPSATGEVVDAFNPGTLTVGAGGVVFWEIPPQFLHVDEHFVLPPQRPIDVVFDAPPGPVQGVDTSAFANPDPSLRRLFLYPYDTAGGNIPPFTADTVRLLPTIMGLFGIRARRFPVAGTYHYHSALYGTTGTILVRPWVQ